MADSYLAVRPMVDALKSQPQSRWLVIVMFAIIIGLELVTSAEYVFSYFYIGPLLLSNACCSRLTTTRLTLLACALIVMNLWIPGSHIITLPTIINRLIAVSALVVTDILSGRNRYYAEAIAQQSLKLQFQEKLASLREDFVSTLTHDLRTPILGAIETLKAFQQERFGPINSAQQQVLAMMTRSSQSSLQLVETVLDIYHNDAEGIRLERSPIDLAALIAQVVETLNDLALSYQVSMVIQALPAEIKPATIQGDALQLQRVLTNLIINAIHHSPSQGTVTIRHAIETRHPAASERPLCRAVITVADEGPGILTEELPQLFDRFYQGRSDRQAKGAGLGLYLSRQIVEAHHGTIWAENQTPRGALFGFCIPS
ncbi:MAG TPA: ATP-binding protein [Chroococcidiopsis sp.]